MSVAAGLAMGAIGAIGGAFGASKQAKAAKAAAQAQLKAAEQGRKLYSDETKQGMVRQMLFAFGKDAIPYLEQNMDPNDFAELFGKRMGITDAEIQSELQNKQNLDLQLSRVGIDKTKLVRKPDGTFELPKGSYDKQLAKDLNINPSDILNKIRLIDSKLTSYGVDETGFRGLQDANRQSMLSRRQQIEAWKNDPNNYKKDSNGNIKRRSDGTPEYVDDKQYKALLAEDADIVKKFNQFGYDAQGVQTPEFAGKLGQRYGGKIDQSTLGRGYLGDLEALSKEFQDKTGQMLGQYDTQTQQLMERSGQLGLGLEQYAKGEEAKAQRETARGLTAANRAAAGRLASTGLGQSTLMSNQLAENQRLSSENLQDRLSAIADKRFQVGLGLKQGELGILQDRLTRRTGLEGSLLNQEYALKAQPLAAKQGLFTGQIFNPYLGVNTMQMFSGASPGAAGADVWGKFLQGTGGQLAGYGFGQAMNSLGQQQQQYSPNVLGQSGQGVYGSDPNLIGPPAPPGGR